MCGTGVEQTTCASSVSLGPCYGPQPGCSPCIAEYTLTTDPTFDPTRSGDALVVTLSASDLDRLSAGGTVCHPIGGGRAICDPGIATPNTWDYFVNQHEGVIASALHRLDDFAVRSQILSYDLFYQQGGCRSPAPDGSCVTASETVDEQWDAVCNNQNWPGQFATLYTTCSPVPAGPSGALPGTTQVTCQAPAVGDFPAFLTVQGGSADSSTSSGLMFANAAGSGTITDSSSTSTASINAFLGVLPLVGSASLTSGATIKTTSKDIDTQSAQQTLNLTTGLKAGQGYEVAVLRDTVFNSFLALAFQPTGYFASGSFASYDDWLSWVCENNPGSHFLDVARADGVTAGGRSRLVLPPRSPTLPGGAGDPTLDAR